MNNENLKILVAAASGAIAGLLLGMVLWGGGDRKKKLSEHLATLGDIIGELEELDTREARDLKEKIKSILGSVGEILGAESGSAGQKNREEEKNKGEEKDG